MNAFIRPLGIWFVAIVGLAVAAEPEVRVAANRGLHLAVVATGKTSEARDALHQAFAASLAGSLTQQCKGAVNVRPRRVGADFAAFNLGTGVYDAVLVIGRDVPPALRRADAITLSAVPESGKRDRMLYLLVPNGDASLQGMLATAFTRALSDEKFLQSFAVVDGRAPTAAESKVVAAR